MSLGLSLRPALAALVMFVDGTSTSYRLGQIVGYVVLAILVLAIVRRLFRK